MNCVEIKGNGPPLVMLHGWGQNLKALAPLGELLSPLASPYLFDLPGFGGSDAPPSVWSAKDYADFLVQSLEEKKIRRFSLLGHSFGGKVALSIALKYPERVEKLVLIAPSGLRAKRTFWKRLKIAAIIFSGKAVKAYDRMSGTKHFANSFAPKFGSRDYNNAGGMRDILVKSVNEDLTEELPKIQTRTLILWGEKDQETPLEAGLRFATLIPKARLIRFPYHDHELFQDVGAHLAATCVAPFLQEDKG